MSKTREQIAGELDANIPRDVVEQRDAGQGRRLSYLAGWYVINRMNEIFGADGWSYDVTELRNVHAGTITGKYGDIHSASYVATVQLFVQFPGDVSAKRLTDVGFGNGTDKSDPGKPHELATKEAVTDAIKRCAKSLGMSLGLALYDKSGEFVGETVVNKVVPFELPLQKEINALEAKVQAGITEMGVQRVFIDAPLIREALNKRITAMSKVVIAKKLKTIDELKADMKTKYGADNTAGLDDAEAKDLLTNLEKLANGT